MTGGSTPPSDTRVRRNSPNRDSSSKKPSNTPLPIHVDDPMRVGQVLADALGKPRAHVTRHQGDPVRVAVMVHEVPRELLDGARALAGDHADHVAPVRSATTVMYLWPLRLVSSMPMASTPV